MCRWWNEKYKFYGNSLELGHKFRKVYIFSSAVQETFTLNCTSANKVRNILGIINRVPFVWTFECEKDVYEKKIGIKDLLVFIFRFFNMNSRKWIRSG